MPPRKHPISRDEEPMKGEHPFGAPFAEPWRREIYERITRMAWPLIKRPLVGYGPSGRSYVPREIERRIEPVVLHLTHAVVSPTDQVTLLRAVPAAWGMPSEPLGPDHVIPERERVDLFTLALRNLLGGAYGWQKDYDRSLRMPRRLLRHPLELGHGAALWERHLQARATTGRPLPATHLAKSS